MAAGVPAGRRPAASISGYNRRGSLRTGYRAWPTLPGLVRPYGVTMSSMAIGSLWRPRVRRAAAEWVLVAGVALAIGVRIFASAEPGARPPGVQAYLIGRLIAALL